MDVVQYLMVVAHLKLSPKQRWQHKMSQLPGASIQLDELLGRVTCFFGVSNSLSQNF